MQCNFIRLGVYYYSNYDRRGGTSRPIITSMRTPTATHKSVDVVDSSSAPTIRKEFPESWLFDSIEDSQGYIEFIYDFACE